MDRRSVIDRSAWLVAHGMDPVAWARRHGIRPVTAPCPGCGVEQTTSVPFAAPRGARGLVAPRCSCGYERPPYCVVVDQLTDL